MNIDLCSTENSQNVIDKKTLKVEALKVICVILQPHYYFPA